MESVKPKRVERVILRDDLRRLGPAFALHRVQILREFQRQARSFFHVALNCLLVPPQGLPFGRLAQVAALDIQVQLNLPRPEGVAMHVAPKQFLDQAVELRQHCVAVWKGIVHNLVDHIVLN